MCLSSSLAEQYLKHKKTMLKPSRKLQSLERLTRSHIQKRRPMKHRDESEASARCADYSYQRPLQCDVNLVQRMFSAKNNSIPSKVECGRFIEAWNLSCCEGIWWGMWGCDLKRTQHLPYKLRSDFDNETSKQLTRSLSPQHASTCGRKKDLPNKVENLSRIDGILNILIEISFTASFYSWLQAINHRRCVIQTIRHHFAAFKQVISHRHISKTNV